MTTMTGTTITPRQAIWKKRQHVVPYVLLFPALVFVVGILGYAVVRAFWTSLHIDHVLSIDKPFVGLDVYIGLFQTRNFINSLVRSVIFVFSSVSLGLFIALAAALSLYAIRFLVGPSRAASLVPYMVSGISAAVTWRFLFSGDASLINMLIEMTGREGISWLGHPNRAMLVVILANVWKIAPFSVLILLSGLQSIDSELFDAAAIDGATGYRKLRYITLPLIAPMIGVSVVWLNFASFNMFDIVLGTTGGGPGRATDLLAVHLYRLAFQHLDFSSASAVMIILLVFNVLISAASLRASKV